MNRTISLLAFIIVATIANGQSVPSYNVCEGSIFEIHASGVSDLDAFDRVVDVYSVNEEDKRARKIKARILEATSDTVTCEWRSSKLPPGVYKLYLTNRKEREKQVHTVSELFQVRGPDLESAWAESTGEEKVVVLNGNYFGVKRPNVDVEFTDPDDATQTLKRKCKIIKPLNYPDAKGKSQKFCMDPESGNSQVRVAVPEAAWSAGEITLLLTNKLGSDSITLDPNSRATVTLTLSLTPEGGGVCSPDPGSYQFESGQYAFLSCSPSAGYRFDEWQTEGSVELTVVNEPDTLAFLNGDASVTAKLVKASPEIRFAGIQLACSTDTSKVDLAWGEAASNTTSASQIKYHVYVGTENSVDSVYQPDNLAATLTGEVEYTVDGLEAENVYYFLVVAEDSEETTNDNHRLAKCETMSAAMTMDREIRELGDVVSSDITISEDESTATFSGNYTDTLKVDDPIMVVIGDQEALKKITAARFENDNTILGLEDGTLDYAIYSGQLRSQGTLTKMENLPGESSATPKARASFLGRRERSLKTRGYRTYLHPEGKFLIWRKETDPGRWIVEPENVKGYEGETNFEHGVIFDYDLSFEPSLETSAKWKERNFWYDRLDALSVVAGGSLKLSGELGYYIAGSASFTAKKEEFVKAGIALTYAAGPVPVYQEVDLSLNAELTFSVDASITAKAIMEMEKSLKLGVKWERGQGWSTVTEDGFSRSVTYELNSEAGMKITLTVYPSISTTFYKSASAGFSAYPTLGVDAEADLMKMEFDKFDIDFWVDGGVNAALKVFSFELASWESDKFTILDKIKLFSLPELSYLSPIDKEVVDENIMYYAKITDGVNNKVPLRNITWTVAPSEGATLTPNPTTDPIGAGVFKHGAKLHTQFEDPEKRTYTLKTVVQGDGFLGKFGKRSVTTPVEITSCRIMGTIKDGDGNALQGASLTLTDADGEVGKTKTDNAGNYLFKGLGKGTYTVTPSKLHYEFDPESKRATIQDTSVTGVDFTAEQPHISGHVADDDGVGLPGFTVNLTGTQAQSATTNGDGEYIFRDLPEGDYVVTPQGSCDFAPVSTPVKIKHSSVDNIDFLADTLKITGTVSPAPGEPDNINDRVYMELLDKDGKKTTETTTNSSGVYAFRGLYPGDYTVQPMRFPGYTFNPGDHAVTLVDQDATGIDFTIKEDSGAPNLITRDLFFRDDIANMPTPPVEVGGTLYFRGVTKESDGSEWEGLWKTDGTQAGTSLVMKADTEIRGLAAVGDTIYFSTWNIDDLPDQYTFYKTDGTTAGVTMIRKMVTCCQLQSVNGLLVLVGDGPSLWRSDGTAGGTYEIYDVNVTSCTRTNGVLYLQDGSSVYKTDGTAAGTVKLFDSPFGYYSFQAAGDAIYGFTYNNDIIGYEFWGVNINSGSATKLMTDLYEGGDLYDYGGTLLYFCRRNRYDHSFWRCGSPSSGASEIEIVEGFSMNDDIASAGGLTYNGVFYFIGLGPVLVPDTENEYETKYGLWKSNGTAAGTELVIEFDYDGGLVANLDSTAFYNGKYGINTLRLR